MAQWVMSGWADFKKVTSDLHFRTMASETGHLGQQQGLLTTNHSASPNKN